MTEKGNGMNLYAVLSEELSGYEGPIAGYAPTLHYCIWQLVVAKNHSQAKYLAWKDDCRCSESAFGPNDWKDITEMPRMKCRKVSSSVKGYAAGVVSDKGEFDDYWPEDMAPPKGEASG